MKHLPFRLSGKRWIRIAQIFLCLCLGSPLVGAAQSEQIPIYGRFSVQGGIGNQTIGYPFQNLVASANPAITDVGIAFRLNKSLTHTFSISLANTYQLNEITGNAYIVNLSLSYRYTHKTGVFGGVGIDIGNSIMSRPRQGYQWDETAGIYTEQKGVFSAGYSGFGLMAGYDLGPTHGKRYSLFVQHKFGIQTPYFPTESFPIMPQNILAIGIGVKLNKFTKSKPQS